MGEQGQWTVLQGAEDTELLRKDAVHHLVKVPPGPLYNKIYIILYI